MMLLAESTVAQEIYNKLNPDYIFSCVLVEEVLLVVLNHYSNLLKDQTEL